MCGLRRRSDETCRAIEVSHVEFAPTFLSMFGGSTPSCAPQVNVNRRTTTPVLR